MRAGQARLSSGVWDTPEHVAVDEVEGPMKEVGMQRTAECEVSTHQGETQTNLTGTKAESSEEGNLVRHVDRCLKSSEAVICVDWDCSVGG